MNELDQAKELLGYICTDDISGLTGLCDAYVEYHTGSVQVCLQPRGDGRTMPEAYFIDVYNVIKEGDTPKRPVKEVPEPTNFLGKKIVDSITGIKGTATKKITYINGCERYTVTHTKLDNSGMMVQTVIAAQDIILDEPVKAEKKKKEETKPRTGGPAMRAERF